MGFGLFSAKREFDQLTSIMRDFCTSRPLASRQILHDHPELLTDRVDELLGSAIEYFRSEGGSDGAISMFERGRATLRVAREQGIDAGFAPLLTAEGLDHSSEEDVHDLCTYPTSHDLAILLDERPWMLTEGFECHLARWTAELREVGADRQAVIMDNRRYLVHRCRLADIAMGLAQAHVVQLIRGEPELRARFRLSHGELMELMDVVAELCAEGVPLNERRALIASRPELLGDEAEQLMKALLGYGLPDAAHSALSMALYLAMRTRQDGIDEACRITALVDAYGTDVDDETAVARFDEYLNLAGEDAASVIEPDDVKEFEVDWPTIRRRHGLLEAIRVTRPQRVLVAIEHFCRAYTPDQTRHLLQTAPILLSELAEQALIRYRNAVADDSDEITLFLLDDRIRTLRRAREAGIETALAESIHRHVEQAFARGEVTQEQVAQLREGVRADVANGSASVMLDAVDAAGPALTYAALLAKQPWAVLHVIEQTISRTPEGSRERAGLLIFKDGLLQDATEHSPVLGDIDDAIESLEEASRCECSDSDRTVITGQLGIMWRKRFGLTHSPTDLGRALALLKDAVRRTPRPPSTPVQADLLARRLTNLGIAQFSSRSHPLGGGDIDAAVANLREAVDVTPDSCPLLVQAKRRNALASALTTRKGPGDDEDALQLYREARDLAEAAPNGHELLPGLLVNLSSALRDLAQENHDLEHSAEALSLLERACKLASDEQPGLTLHAGSSWGRAASRMEDWDSATRGYRYMLTALRRLTASQVTRVHKEAVMLQAANDALAAVYAIARAGHHTEAVEALEGARAVVVSELLERDRTDLDALIAEGHARLAEQFDAAVSRLRAMSGLAGPDIAPMSSGRLQQLTDELEQITAEIRALPGHADFREALSIRAIAQQAPIAYLAACEFGGVAFVVREDTSVTPVWLEELTSGRVAEWADRLLETPSDRNVFLRVLEDLTQWLWGAAMAPLLAEVHELDALTFVSCGLLGLLPLHAAWTPDTSAPTGRRYALDELLVTYTVNARACASARILATHGRTTGVLAVDDPRPVDAGPLPYSRLEAKTALRWGGHSGTWLRHGQATRSAVMDALRESAVAHLSCHGEANLADPLESALLLADDRLTLRDVTDLNGTRLAVLSACETGRIGGRLPDEVIGFPAALLASGVPAVVGSLWAVPSAATAELMARFYTYCREGSASPSEALRRAQQAVRDSTVAEKRAFFEEHLPGESVPISYAPAGSRPHARPYHWAAFTCYGV
ncbi:CHAT domain-containing protein [Streptomyces luteogriseus]|uniref:CHAT domain-containing protein n=1 Tax=Streptomyces luteogriseus TaxID=68233 RepID=UPI0037A09C0E